MRRLLLGLFVSCSLIISGAILAPWSAYAATPGDLELACKGEGSIGIEVLPRWYKYLEPEFDPDTQSCNLTKGFPDSIPLILLAVFEILLRIAGILAVVFVVYGGFQYLTSTGEPDKAKAARTTIINALVGVMIVVFATVIVNVVGWGLR